MDSLAQSQTYIFIGSINATNITYRLFSNINLIIIARFTFLIWAFLAYFLDYHAGAGIQLIKVGSLFRSHAPSGIVVNTTQSVIQIPEISTCCINAIDSNVENS